MGVVPDSQAWQISRGLALASDRPKDKDATQALQAIVRAARFRRPSQAGRVEKIIDKFGG